MLEAVSPSGAIVVSALKGTFESSQVNFDDNGQIFPARFVSSKSVRFPLEATRSKQVRRSICPVARRRNVAFLEHN